MNRGLNRSQAIFDALEARLCDYRKRVRGLIGWTETAEVLA